MSNQARPSPASQPSQTGMSSTMTHSGHGQQIPHERIAKRAYEKWCQRGCKDGTHQQDWYEAEAELRAEMSGKSMSGHTPHTAQPQSMPQKTAQRR
jgi:hypothetical protein